MSNTTLDSITLSDPSNPIGVHPYNLLEHHRQGSQLVKLLRKPGRYEESRPSKGLHKLQNLLQVFSHPHIDQARFATVNGMIDPATNAPTVALVSTFHEKGNILKQSATMRQRVKWLIQICKAVEYLHKKNIVHGNIYPGNILISSNEHKAVLTDVGVYASIAEHLMPLVEGDRQASIHCPESITCKTVAAVGNHDGKVPASQTTKDDDIFALGVTIWTVYQREKPWKGQNVSLKILSNGHGALPRPQGMGDGLWNLLGDLLSQHGNAVPSIQEIEQALVDALNLL
ncbi:kinase-like protein [Macrolepiota fuliginosa MF-IS2]|uniref:Kinase-like protein n=1 Tax=Macrolepiota fuliginosa MF-IS2 TaxID=1400762 RepID=A0A9P5XAX6_9AGAR|nr:kinase-like protein [Macrolepiota fuliginosa MF-IS2]